MVARAKLLHGARRRVALIVETSNAYARGLLEGIIDYVRENDPWELFLPEQSRGESAPKWLRTWRGDGIIARIENRATALSVAKAGLPAVDVSAGRFLPGLPWVETDDAAISGMVFAHLAERGFKSFAYCGDSSFNWSNWRCDQFAKLVGEAGGSLLVFDARAAGRQGASWDRQQQRLSAWLEGLPRPTGVMACYDIMAQKVLEASRASGIAVPEEIAVIGVDNDDLLCRLAVPPLSSVVLDARRAGYEAASLLDRAMAGGGKQIAESRRIPPLGITVRQSTDVLAISDRHVAESLRFIREHACEGIGVKDVLDQSPLSRRALEAKFRKLVGRTPHEELVRARLTQVKLLLAETDMPVARIAEQTGYEHIEYLSVQFHRVVGVPPLHYRKQHRTDRGTKGSHAARHK